MGASSCQLPAAGCPCDQGHLMFDDSITQGRWPGSVHLISTTGSNPETQATNPTCHRCPCPAPWARPCPPPASAQHRRPPPGSPSPAPLRRRPAPPAPGSRRRAAPWPWPGPRQLLRPPPPLPPQRHRPPRCSAIEQSCWRAAFTPAEIASGWQLIHIVSCREGHRVQYDCMRTRSQDGAGQGSAVQCSMHMACHTGVVAYGQEKNFFSKGVQAEPEVGQCSAQAPAAGAPVEWEGRQRAAEGVGRPGRGRRLGPRAWSERCFMITTCCHTPPFKQQLLAPS